MIMGRFSSQSAFLFLLLPFAILCNLGVCELKASCNENDKQILLCFKHGLTDPSDMLSTWSNKEDCCEWRGVQCDINGRVTNLSLPCSTNDSLYVIDVKNNRQCLAGEFHLSLLELEFLMYLNLSNNNFQTLHLSLDCQNSSHVNTPQGRGNFSNLAYLDLSKNENLVIDDLRWLLRLSSLEYLNLDSIDLHKQTYWLQILTMLEFLNYLNLGNNNFQAMQLSLDCQNSSHVNTPHGRGNFSNLAYLDLSENENLVIDDLRWLLRLSSLEYLYLDSIDLHKQTQWLQIMSMLPSLSVLSLSGCSSESASPSLEYANFTSLKYLDLSYNGFFSELPNWLFNLSGLSSLNLLKNRFHGQIPNTLLNLRNLQHLKLSDNILTGTIPDWLGQLESLQYLDLSWNSFTGFIPTTLGNLSSLLVFDVNSNNLTGSLPESLWQLSNLEVLGIGDNYLSGVVSHRNLSKLTNLQILYLGSLYFIFDFDPHWIPPFQLQKLFLEYADLKLLPWLYTQTSLNTLEIDSSSFTVESADKFWSWTTDLVSLTLNSNTMHWDMSNVLLNSEVIMINGNGLSGGLPRLTSNVKVFEAAGNSLSGSLSPLLCHKLNEEKNNLQYLSLTDNLLSGGITDCWENWKSLVHVSLAYNNLTGMIPHSMGTLSNLLSLQLHTNNLHGEIPMSLKNCQKFMILSLSENKFSGSIPNWFGQDMKALLLRSNEFSGDIPLQICQLSSLTVLDLADNRLTGIIPPCLHNITAMVLNNASTGDELGITNADTNLVFKIGLPLLTKGNELYYLNYIYVLDLSSNHLVGKIPVEVFKLTVLQSLNLSHNQLTGTIPEEIGNMKQLESLDFSNNTLSGEIPQSMSALSFLEVLNLSFNNLRGQIPLGTQLQSFTALSYEGNPELCGNPLIKKCNHDEAPGDPKLMGNDEKGSELLEWFYMGTGVGFATSFSVVFGSLLFIQKWRHAYFKFLADVKDKLYVKIVLKCTPSIEI